MISIKSSRPGAQPGSLGGASQGTAGGNSQGAAGGMSQGGPGGSSRSGTSGIPQGQPGMGTAQQGVSFSNIPPAGTGSSGMTGLGTGQQAPSRPGTGFTSGTQMGTNNQFLSGISPPGIMSSSGSTAGSSLTGQQGTRLSGTFGMPQTQGTSSGSTTGQGTSMSGSQGSSFATGLSMFSPGMPGASQSASQSMVDLATRGQGSASQIRDLTSQPQRMPTQSGTGTIGTRSGQPQSMSGQRSPTGAGTGQSMFSPSGQSSSGSQFQSMPGFVGSPTVQSSFGLTNTFQNSASSSIGTGAGFGQMPGRPSPQSGQTAGGQPGILTPPGFSRNIMSPPGGAGAFSGSFNRQQSVGGMSPSRQFGSGPRPDRPLRMNSDQPSTRMQPLDRGTSFSGGRGMPGMPFGMGTRGMTDFTRGMPEMRRRPDGPFPDLSRTVGMGGMPDMGRRVDGRGMIDILRSRGMPFMDPRAPVPDPRARGMGPGMAGPSRFAPPGMAPRGMPPPALMERLRMLRRMRGF